jgi:hypothetical protein
MNSLVQPKIKVKSQSHVKHASSCCSLYIFGTDHAENTVPLTLLHCCLAERAENTILLLYFVACFEVVAYQRMYMLQHVDPSNNCGRPMFIHLVGLNVSIFLEIGRLLRNITTVTWILECYYRI